MAHRDRDSTYPLYDATYTAFRLSPLYHGANALLEETALCMHARRLHGALHGGILRGVEVGAGVLDDRSGALESCAWDLIGDEESWDRLHHQGTEEQQDQPGDLTDASSLDVCDARGVHVELRYEKATYTALLLRDPDAEDTAPPPEGFTALPLLLVRMPVALREVFKGFLADTFDTRIGPMTLCSDFLCATLEDILSQLHDMTSSPPPLIPRIQVQLSFPIACPTGALHAIDITIPRQSILDFLLHQHTGPCPLHATVSPTTNTAAYPFTTALACYLKTHLALNMSHPEVHIAKFAIPSIIALSTDGRLKLFAPEKATTPPGLFDAFYGTLLRVARGAPVPDADETRSLSIGNERGKMARAETLVNDKQKASGKGKGKGKDEESQKRGDVDEPVVRKRRKRALGDGDGNSTIIASEPDASSPGTKRNSRQQHAAGEANKTLAGSSQRATTDADAAGLVVPHDPPPPYQLHDPAISQCP